MRQQNKNTERNKIDDLFLDFVHVSFVICGSKWQIAIVLSHDFVSIHLKHVAIDAVPLHTNGFSSEFQVENMQIHFSHSSISTWNEILFFCEKQKQNSFFTICRSTNATVNFVFLHSFEIFGYCIFAPSGRWWPTKLPIILASNQFLSSGENT